MMSFAQDYPLDQSHTYDNPTEVSFAQTLQPLPLENKRDGKCSGKKSALYKKIMREHNLPITSSSTKLNYTIGKIENPHITGALAPCRSTPTAGLTH